ncbi:hypothetical protein J22TS3_00330 [Paenibacillus sp. J22TS3]|nr:hypothetical protein J22TS3_00330 [Paenibacillus sp. J22TS3]
MELTIYYADIHVTKPNPPVAIYFSVLVVEIHHERMQERGI